MCSDRLKAGEAPACVQACPHEAIRIRIVDRGEVVARAEDGVFLSGAPTPRRPCRRPSIDRPPNPGRCVRPTITATFPSTPHWPLVFMLVLTQFSVGGFLLDLAARVAGGSGSSVLVGLSLAFGLMGLAASICHLGRPLYAYRALIGLRHSWLSREVAVFGVFALLAQLRAGLMLMTAGWVAVPPVVHLALAAGAVVAGAAGVGCSVMVYHVVRRPFWHASSAAVKFTGTALVLGTAAALLASNLEPPCPDSRERG